MTARQNTGSIDDARTVEIRIAMRRCKHMTSLGRDHAQCCDAGVNYRALVGGNDLGWITRLPCSGLKDPKNGPLALCEKREVPTEAEATERVDRMLAARGRFIVAYVALKEHAKGQGLGKGKSGASSLPCPKDCGGIVRYSVASNGHMWAKCSTTGCIAFME